MPISAAEKKLDEKFQAESDVRTLVEARDIKRDKSRMKRATAMAKSQLAALSEVSDD